MERRGSQVRALHAWPTALNRSGSSRQSREPVALSTWRHTIRLAAYTAAQTFPCIQSIPSRAATIFSTTGSTNWTS